MLCCVLLHVAHVAGTCVGKVEYSFRPIRQIPSVQGSTELPGPVTYDPAILPGDYSKLCMRLCSRRFNASPIVIPAMRGGQRVCITPATRRGEPTLSTTRLLCWGALDESGCLRGRVYALNTGHPTNLYMSYNESEFLKGGL